MKILLIVMALVVCCDEAFAKKDFKGLFGSYRREKFTENEAKPTNIGVDIMLSTLFPLKDVVRSQEDTAGTTNALNYSVFYNLEASVWYSFNYHWVGYVSFGWYNYSTRRENKATLGDPSLAQTPVFHEFELKSFPILVGGRYRFLRDDIVPYISAGVGMAFTERIGSYDNDQTGQYTNRVKESVLAAHAAIGLEFYFAPNAGLRIEGSGYYLGLPGKSLIVGGSNPTQHPIFLAQPNPISFRYSSGVFFQF